MELFVLLFGLLGIGFSVFLGFLITGVVLRFAAGMVGVHDITLGNAIITSLLGGLAAAAATRPIRLAGWPEPSSLWILGVVVQGAVIRSRFGTGLTLGIVIALVVTIVWLFVGLALLTVARLLFPSFAAI